MCIRDRANATKVVVSNLNDIIETIPDHINVELKPAVKTEQYYTVNLGQDYTLNLSLIHIFGQPQHIDGSQYRSFNRFYGIVLIMYR